MPISEARKRANKKYINAHYATFSVKYPKTDPIFDCLEIAIAKTGKSKAEYVRDALYRQFSIDGIEVPARQDK